MAIPAPSTSTVRPTMSKDKLFTSRELTGHSTVTLADNASHTFVLNNDPAIDMNGVYEIYAYDTVDIAARFTIEGGDTVTLLADYGSDFVVNATTTDAKIQIAASAAGLLIVNRLTASVKLYIAKLF